MKKISVIVPVYNIEECIGRCIDSIRKQTYKELEIILVDDGSTDNSGSICDSYVNKDNRIRVIHQQNRGLSGARNKGLEASTGEYIGFVDGDDWIEEGMYDFLYHILKENEADIAVCGYVIQNSSEADIQEKGNSENVTVYERREAVRAIVEDRRIHSYAWNKLYHRKLFKEIRFPEKRKMEDIATLYKVFMLCERVAVSDIPKYCYCRREGSISQSWDEKMNWDLFSAYLERVDVLGRDYPELREFLVVSLLKFSVTAYNRLLLFEGQALEYEETHRQMIRNTMYRFRKELRSYSGYGNLKVRLFLVSKSIYPYIYRRLKRLVSRDLEKI